MTGTTWTDIADSEIDQDSPITVTLMTALRDNANAVAARAVGPDYADGLVIDYQEFTASGTWTKPAIASANDIVIVYACGGGGGGAQGSRAGAGAGGGFARFTASELAATETVVVGAGGASGATQGSNGGDTSFSSGSTEVLAMGGIGAGRTSSTKGRFSSRGKAAIFTGTNPVTGADGETSTFGGGGGGGDSAFVGGTSIYGGAGGDGGTTSGTAEDGLVPGGGAGGISDTSGTSGTGGDGIARVWVVRKA